ncbi:MULTISPECIES: ABC transporter substrate-binding protein [Limnospira]|uniref:ABC transporter substrate-binding protein n=1 Tax=Limnospira fusiformis PMC 851.14 TaxID=2219512 RepID=A0ABU9EUJ9_LIMFS|nr:ABC transporter substrate-binding protein [Limnospira sp. PMC 917.15]MDT9234861.1 ABC transporter substrate-binding protein [Limnospira sp. PMC 917.15]
MPPIPIIVVSLAVLILGSGSYWLWSSRRQGLTYAVQSASTVAPDRVPELPTESSRSTNKPAPSDRTTTDTVEPPEPPRRDSSANREVDGSNTPVPTVQPVQQRQRFSKGEKALFSGIGNANRDRGIEAFQKGDYVQAADFFNRAIEADRNDPEPLIYYNNALANQKANRFTLAVVVPIDNRLTSAQEMLRGVAQAQHNFNQSGGLNGKFLEILIVNDGNDPKQSSQVASELVKDSSIIGVIGHNSSDASKAGLVIYEKAGLPMISPTSTSTSLTSPVFFRTVPSDKAAGKKLADYAYNDLLVDDAVILYNPNSAYSSSLKEAFEEDFKRLGGNLVRSIDLSDPKFDAKIDVSRIGLTQEAQALLLFPDTQFASVALEVAKANSQLQQGERLKLLGGDALYSPTTLQAGYSVEDLILAVPWFAKSPQSQNFSNLAEKQWGGLVNWRTAMSFDATQAFINAFSENASRSQILTQLQSINLPSSKTSGSPVEFSPEGERRSEPILVRISRGGSVRPANAEFGFEVINE